MLREMPITEARHVITSLPAQLAKNPGAVTVTRRGKPVLAIIPWELYESIMETLDILGDKDFMEMLRRGVKEMNEGKGIPWDKVKRKLDL